MHFSYIQGMGISSFGSKNYHPTNLIRVHPLDISSYNNFIISEISLSYNAYTAVSNPFNIFTPKFYCRLSKKIIKNIIKFCSTIFGPEGKLKTPILVEDKRKEKWKHDEKKIIKSNFHI